MKRAYLFGKGIVAGEARNPISKISGQLLALPGVETRLTAEHAIRAAIDTQIFSSLRELESLDGGRAVQAVYVALIRRLPNVLPDRRRLAIDSGFSESSVKRAIALLEACGLTKVERAKGRSSVYHLADLRVVEVASECLSRIRKLARVGGGSKAKSGRATSEPALPSSRSTSEPSGRVTCGQGVGSEVAQKETRKIPIKQQAAAGLERREEIVLQNTLKKWGLESAWYLARPGHERAIRLLVENPSRAAALIDKTMRNGKWSSAAGVGARVAFLRDNIERAAASIDAEHHKIRYEHNLASNKASEDSKWKHEMDLLEREVTEMSDGEFGLCCERLFSSRPGFRLLYRDTPRASSGLRKSLVEFLWNERQNAVKGHVGDHERRLEAGVLASSIEHEPALIPKRAIAGG